MAGLILQRTAHLDDIVGLEDNVVVHVPVPEVVNALSRRSSSRL